MASKRTGVFIVGIYAADLVFSGDRLPAPGETVIAQDFMRSHGGKGSNQAVAAARAGAEVSFFTLLGKDAFAESALSLWKEEGIRSLARMIDGESTGAASISVDTQTGNNCVFVFPGASRLMTPADIDSLSAEIISSDIFVIQLEQPIDAAVHALKCAHQHGVTAILNPAPACDLPEEIYPYCDYLLPNETEASLLSGITVNSRETAKAAAKVLLERGAKNVIITLGEKGALLCNADEVHHEPAVITGHCVDTTGAGDAFIGGFAAGLSQGMQVREALRFAATLAGISVTRHGAAASMPRLPEIVETMAIEATATHVGAHPSP